jgi:hypothetical protein
MRSWKHAGLVYEHYLGGLLGTTEQQKLAFLYSLHDYVHEVFWTRRSCRLQDQFTCENCTLEMTTI